MTNVMTTAPYDDMKRS